MKNLTNICLQEIKLQEGEDFSTVQLMRVGKFMHPFLDDFEVTTDMFKSFKKNFDDNVKKVDLAVDYSHRSGDEAAGWIREVQLREKGTELWITVDWTETARAKIKDKEFRYMSADFNTRFVDNETGKDFGATLNGAGLTNRPFIKDMQAVLSETDLSDDKKTAILSIINDETKEKDDKMNPEELKAHIATLSDAEKKEMGLIEEVQLSDEDSKEALAKSEKEKADLELKLAEQEKEHQFSTMLAKGEAVEAQRDAYMKGDVAAFAKLSATVNLDPKGDGESEGKKEEKKKDDEPKTFDEATTAMEDIVNEKMAKDENLTFSEASKIAMSENPELTKIMDAAE